MSHHFTSYLRSHGYRMTPQRMVILHILQEADGHLSPVEICARARPLMPGITEATIYRTLNFLTGIGLVLATHIGGGQLVYEIAEHAHHHLVCRKCGQTQMVEHSVLQALYEQFEASTGFEIDTVHLTFFGLCPACRHE